MAVLGAELAALADMGWGWGHHGWWGGSLMMFAWALLVAALVIVLAQVFDRRGQAPRTSDAEQVLAARYARGEIDETEYRARRAVLEERR